MKMGVASFLAPAKLRGQGLCLYVGFPFPWIGQFWNFYSGTGLAYQQHQGLQPWVLTLTLRQGLYQAPIVCTFLPKLRPRHARACAEVLRSMSSAPVEQIAQRLVEMAYAQSHSLQAERGRRGVRPRQFGDVERLETGKHWGGGRWVK